MREKFGQGVYWGDGGWRAQIMGGGKRVAGSGGLGEWVSGGRLTADGGEVAGRACPAPTGWWKEAGGQTSTSGESPFHPIFTQALHVSP